MVRRRYRRWQPALSNYWPQVQAGGQRLVSDPFETLLNIHTEGEIPGNWRAMEVLPAARESLDQFLLDRIGE